MIIDSLRRFCLSLPGATEDMPWEDTLCFRLRRKIFAIVALDPGAEARISLKCSSERFSEMLEVEGTRKAPYVGRFQWIALEALDVLSDRDLCNLVRHSYEQVAAKLPKTQQPRAAVRSR
jgi:predicted DNA-binding protein (MmcQ/YjbR family)